VDGFKSAKEVWDTLFINHEGTKQVREGRIRALESELNHFVIKDDESPQDMYNRLNKIIYKMKSLGSTRWGRREVVDKILSAYMARDVQLIAEAKLWVWQGGSLHCGVPQHQGENKGYQQE
jgi:hypothetical protein